MVIKEYLLQIGCWFHVRKSRILYNYLFVFEYGETVAIGSGQLRRVHRTPQQVQAPLRARGQGPLRQG